MSNDAQFVAACGLMFLMICMGCSACSYVEHRINMESQSLEAAKP